MKILIGIFFTSCIAVFYALVVEYPALYTHKEVPRLQEYYPAIVISKDQVDMCNAFTCTTANELGLELSDKSFRTVNVTDAQFDAAVVNSTINLERHITDPNVRERTELRIDLKLLLAFLSIFTLGLYMAYAIRKSIEQEQQIKEL